MFILVINVIYVLLAIAMIALILMQRGSGAQAGAGFGGGASATVFGARGASNFLSKSTAVLAAIFFVMALGMAMYATRGLGTASPDADLGVMGAAVLETPVAPDAAPAVPADVPAAPEANPAPVADAPAAGDAPAAEEIPAVPAEQEDNGG